MFMMLRDNPVIASLGRGNLGKAKLKNQKAK